MQSYLDGSSQPLKNKLVPSTAVIKKKSLSVECTKKNQNKSNLSQTNNTAKTDSSKDLVKHTTQTIEQVFKKPNSSVNSLITSVSKPAKDIILPLVPNFHQELNLDEMEYNESSNKDRRNNKVDSSHSSKSTMKSRKIFFDPVENA